MLPLVQLTVEPVTLTRMALALALLMTSIWATLLLPKRVLPLTLKTARPASLTLLTVSRMALPTNVAVLLALNAAKWADACSRSALISL
jgi:hypothetical protein